MFQEDKCNNAIETASGELIR